MESNEDTVQINTEQNKRQKKSRPRRGIWILFGILLILLFGVAGWLLGTEKGKQLRLQAQEDQLVTVAATQFQLGVEELNAKRYEIAKKRFEYVIELVPNFPGAQEKLTEVMVAMAQVSTPTPIPTPTLTPTPDLRSEEELFQHAHQLMLEEDWDNALMTLDALRQSNIEYRTVDVDGMYYLSLRNRGVERILYKGDLEPGIYDLAVSEKFAPLDVEADSYRTWARYYISGASFWGLDWAQVVSIFGQIYPAFPNLRDASGMTATERYRVGLIKWGDQLMLQEQYCDAVEKYDLALAVAPDESVSTKLTQANDECEKSKEPEKTEPPATATPTPTLEGGATQIPTEVVTESPGQQTPVPSEPTATPVPSETTTGS